MNNFKGVLEEYRNIAIDYFEGDSLKCNVYLLSHCHTDHMTGLDNDVFFNRLRESSEVKLYCSQITKDLVSNDSNGCRYSRLRNYLFSLPVNEPTTIRIRKLAEDDYETVVVTLLSAGHCPGSVMFLFEGNSGTVIYTGDFRLTVDQLRIMEHLHYGGGDSVKRIDNLYLDTTFCVREALEFPSRTESRDTLFAHVDLWLKQSTDTAIYVNGNSQYGYEHVFVELAKRYGMKVHVCKGKLWKYGNIPELLESVTNDETETRLHACFYKDRKGIFNGKNGVLPCERNLPLHRRRKLLYVNLSTMWFNNHASSDITSYECSGNFVRVLYSMHSSYREILELVRYLNPRCLRPIVIPEGTTLELLLQQLKSCRDVNDLERSFQRYVSSSESETSCFGVLNDALKKSSSASMDSQLNLEDSLPLGANSEAKCVESSTSGARRVESGHCDGESEIRPYESGDSGAKRVESSERDGESEAKSVELGECGDEEASSPEWRYIISPIKNNKTDVSSFEDSEKVRVSSKAINTASFSESNESKNQWDSVSTEIASLKQSINAEDNLIQSRCISAQITASSGDAELSQSIESENKQISDDDRCNVKNNLNLSQHIKVSEDRVASGGSKCVSRGIVNSCSIAIFDKYLGHLYDDSIKVSKKCNQLLKNQNFNSNRSETSDQRLELHCDSDETESYDSDDEVKFVESIKSKKPKLFMQSPVPDKIPKLIDLTKSDSESND